ncbi:helix-turn-helix transcriptional regulator [Dactylosporangium sp. NPDC005555]|uniref:helix-turn-helix transcriptional regulator n=1 Tax=Dactylosporangium sp. NPDC005555 TaxID=3154889 RepID=UPI0033AFAF47
MSQTIDPTESLGALLTRVRQAQGKSQVRLAGLLCAASGQPTLTRHEVSRWEREERIPSQVWLGWLALVLDTPLDELERAAARTRRRREPTMTRTTTTGTATTRPAPARVTPSGGAPPGGEGPGVRVAELRRMDDLVAGPELVALVLADLRSAIRDAGTGRGSPGRVAELAQLHAWVAIDAGRAPLEGVQRGGVRAAGAAGDRALAGHLLGCVAQAAAERGDGPAALRAAFAAERVAARCDPATSTALALRVAFAAAVSGDQRTCDAALATAERSHGRRERASDPPWLYWLDDAHVHALTGLSLTAAGRPAAALPHLAAAARSPAVRFRAAGLVAAAMARAHLTAGDLDAACAAASEALLACVDSGSFRVLRRLRRLESALHAAVGAGRLPASLIAYSQLAGSAASCLPGAAPAPPGQASTVPLMAPVSTIAVASASSAAVGSERLRGRVAS